MSENAEKRVAKGEIIHRTPKSYSDAVAQGYEATVGEQDYVRETENGQIWRGEMHFEKDGIRLTMPYVATYEFGDPRDLRVVPVVELLARQS